MSTAALLQNLAAKPKALSNSSHAGLLLQRKCACGSPTTSLTGECAECKSKKRLQTKLTIGASNDPLEQEADRVAEQVLAAPAHSAVGSAPPRIQRYTGQATEGTNTAPASVDQVLATPGRPLDAALRQDMEQRFGYDFSRVRVHSGTAAEQSARDVSANAYTVRHNIVFGAGRFAPGTGEGRRLIAHELTHVLQQGEARRPTHSLTDDAESDLVRGAAEKRLSRQPDEDEEERKKRAAVAQQQLDAGVTAEAGTATTDKPPADAGGASNDIPASDAGTGTPDAGTPSPLPSGSSSGDVAPPPVQPAQPAPSAETSGGHTPAPAGMAPCPDAPTRSLVVLACTTPSGAAPPKVEKAELPALNLARFGGDPDRAKFAKELAQCHAARVVKEEIDKRYRAAVSQAKTQATDEAKVDTEKAVKAATEAVDPKDKRAIDKAKAQATSDAKKAAAKKIADAHAAVKREDITTVTAELSRKFEDELATDYGETMRGVLGRYGPSWLAAMQSKLESERQRITKEKNAKPKVAKGETPPPAKSETDIAGAIEAEMADVRCSQQEWALNRFEAMARAWAVGRREQVDFQTIPQKAAFLSKFGPTYDPAQKDRVDIPANVQKQKMTPVAPETAEFLARLAADPKTPTFSAENRSGHGGGLWAGKGFSLDMYIKAGMDQRGFWQHSTAVAFLLQLDATAKAMGARWRVLYDDFRVAEEVNAATGTRNVEFIGTSGGGQLNWHGPDPLILHFHLDLEIPQKPPVSPGGTP